MSDIVYHNITLTNQTPYNKNIEYDETRQTALVTGTDYVLSIIRFSVPLHRLPLMIYKKSGKYIFNTDITPDEDMDFFFNNNQVIYSSDEIFNRIHFLLNALSNNNEHFIRIITKNDRLCLLVAVPYVNNPDNYYFEMTPDAYFTFFSGFSATFIPASNHYRIRFREDITALVPANTYAGVAFDTYLFEGSHNSLSSWQHIRRLVFMTNTIQLESEGVSYKRHSTDHLNYDNNRATSNILTDFEIPYEDKPVQKDYLFYQPTVYRYMSIIYPQEVKKLDLNVYYIDPDTNILYPLEMPPNSDLFIKLMFKRKTLL